MPIREIKNIKQSICHAESVLANESNINWTLPAWQINTEISRVIIQIFETGEICDNSILKTNTICTFETF